MQLIKAIIISNDEITKDIFNMIIKTSEIAQTAIAGQFVELFVDNNKNILPRPISICEVDKKENTIRLIYQKIGEGTTHFSKMKAGSNIRVLGALGNGYNLPIEKSLHILVGGGIGVPPLLELCKNLKGEIVVILGFRNNSFLTEEFEKLGAKVYVATEDGSVGIKGNVIDILKNNDINGKYMYSCGPKPMLKAIANYAKEKNIDTQISMEERMACGVGACVCCVTKIYQDGKITNKKVCKDGPVFKSYDIVFD